MSTTYSNQISTITSPRCRHLHSMPTSINLGSTIPQLRVAHPVSPMLTILIITFRALPVTHSLITPIWRHRRFCLMCLQGNVKSVVSTKRRYVIRFWMELLYLLKLKPILLLQEKLKGPLLNHKQIQLQLLLLRAQIQRKIILLLILRLLL